jgi:hypothetical protein
MAEGFGSGLAEGLNTSMQQQLGQVALQEGRIKVESEGIAVKQAQLMLDSQKKVAAALSHMNGDGDPANHAAQQLNAIADIYAQSGLPDQAADYYSKASTLQKNQAEIASKVASDEMDDMQTASNILANVTNEQQLKQAAVLMLTERPSVMQRSLGPFMQKLASGQVQYSPGLVKQLQDAAMKNVDQQRVKMDKLRAQNMESEERLRKAEIDRAEAEAGAANALRANREREGATNKQPTGEQIKSITTQITTKYDVTPDEAYKLGLSGARRVQELMDPKGRNLPIDEASDMAFKELEQQGRFRGQKKLASGLGRSKENPLPLPKKESDMQDNTFYRTAKGVLLWDASQKGFVQ